MAKTCRTCTWGSHHFRLYCSAPNGQCYVEPSFVCGSWEELRETPLLVDALATEEECNDVRDATIRKLRVERLDLRVERDGWERGCWEADQQLVKANRRYDECRAAWARLEASLREELAEAKAEGGAWMRRCDELERLLAVQKASIADAEIGRLVRGMRDSTRLVRTRLYYWPEFLEGEQWRNIPLAGLRSPAEALRAIQEMGDAGT